MRIVPQNETSGKARGADGATADNGIPREQQRAEILRCLRTLHSPGDVFEVRALGVPSGRYKNIVSGWFNDLDAAATAIECIDARGAAGVYLTINPCVPAMMARRNNRVEDRPKETTSDDDILCRRWLPIDVDPIRPAGIPATAAELDAARVMAADIEDILRAEGFSFPLIAESGNGKYLLYRVDMPNDEDSRVLLEMFYAALVAAVSSHGASIDKTVGNASRILRIGGTKNRKGDGTPDRPHRPCQYLPPTDECPVGVNSVEIIRAFVAKYSPSPAPKSKPSSNGNGRNDSRLDVPRWLHNRGVSFETKDTGKGIAYQVPCPFNADHGGRGESAVLQQADGMLAYKCMHNGCDDRRWADYRDAIGKPDNDHYDPPLQGNFYGSRQDLGSVSDYLPTTENSSARRQMEDLKSEARGMGWDGDAVEHEQVEAVTKGKATNRTSPTFVTRRYEEIEVEEVSWLWKDRIALGKLSLVAGVPGVGKTFLLCDIAARCSLGHRFADGTEAPLCDTLIMTAEDGPEDTIKPRLIAHGADCCRVHHFDKVDINGKDGYFTLTTYLDLLRKWLQDHPAVKLVVFDPITAFLGDKVDSHKNAEVRAVLGPLCKLAEELGVAIIGITHLSKSEAKAINRVIGSIAFVGAARSCWLVDWDPEADGRRLFLPVKNNLAHADGLAYTITDGAIIWEPDPVTITADDLSDSQHTTPREEAEQWLRQSLQDGRVPSAKLSAEAKREGISERTLKRAKKTLQVVSEKDGSAWYWSLSDDTDISGSTENTTTDTTPRYDFGEHNG